MSRFPISLMLPCLLLQLVIWPSGLLGNDVAQRVRGILSNRCFACHGPDEDERQGGLRLDVRDSFLSAADSGEIPIVPGDPRASELWRRICSTEEYERMPPPDFGAALSSEEVELIRDWIEQGAGLPEHWSFVPPERPAVPQIAGPEGIDQAPQGNAVTAVDTELLSAWRLHPVDCFVFDQQRQQGLHPSPPASRAEVLRRLTFDLTGLPASPEEVAHFESNPAVDAYEREVDRLLASPAYGEHWARKWLDLARYADSAGYADDPPRTIWAYRDWVVRALNDGLPIDEFTIRQIAGDLLDNPTQDDLVATAFHRNTLTNNEGGTNNEEFRNVAVVDRVNTTMAVWMGVTMACAQCHTHKYDPFTQAEYFQLFAIFNQSQDADLKDERPTIPVLSMRQRLEQQALEQTSSVRPEIEPETTVPIMREVKPAERRETFVQIRGNYKSFGERVQPGTPTVFHPLVRKGAPPGPDPESHDGGIEPNRLDLAKWLVDRRNPLTARVWMNRLWESLFGIGIVRSSEEFGAQGDQPSHPELLDWLAVEFMQSGWDQKRMLRLLVTSETYRQTSQVSAEDLDLDRDNIWLARGPRVRLSAEMVRDQALAVSGLLATKMYGPPVRPPQPDMGLKAAFGSGTDWEASQGEDRYRRGLYTTWRRSNPYPSMATFDAPSREVCTLRRDSTNTPLQALVTLNDPGFVEAAQALARRVALRAPQWSSDRQRLEAAFRLATSRNPQASELSRLLELLKDSRQALASQPDAAIQLATDPLGPLPPEADAVELAAYTAVCNVLLNLDEVLMKR